MQTVLGIVTGAKPDKRGERVAWIKPLFDVTDSWREADPNEFPTRGYLFWPQANDAVRDALFFVRPRENSAYTPEHRDEYMVSDPHPAFEVVDLRALGDLEHVRVALNDGIKLSRSHLGRVLIWCDRNLVVGPLGLISGSNGTVMLERSNRHRIGTFEVSPDDIKLVVYDGQSRYVLARIMLGTPDGYVDWDDDRQVIKRAVEYSVEVAKRSGATIDRPKQLVEDAIEQLDGKTSSDELVLEVYRLQRALPLLKDIGQANELASDLLKLLREQPAIKEELNQVKIEERSLVRSEMESALKDERDELARLKSERETEEKALKVREANAKEASRQIEEEMQRTITNAVNNAPALLSHVALLKPFLVGIDREEHEPQRNERPIYSHPTWKLGPTPLSALKELRPKMLSSFKSAGVPVPAWQRLHAAFSAKILPVLACPYALDALSAYAQVATAGRIAIIEVTGAISEPSDIFGRLDPATRSFIPHPAGLIDIVSAAKDSTGLMVIVLNGVNRAATESYLMPLVRAIQRQDSSIPLFHPTAINAGDRYQAFARVEWPKNLLLAATLVEGPTSLPFCPDLWAHSILLVSEPHDNHPYQRSKYTELSEIDPGSLFLADPCTEPVSGESFEEIIRLTSSWEVASRFEHAIKVLQTDATALQLEVLNAVVVPHIASIADDSRRNAAVNEIKKALGPKSDLRVADAVDFARRRLG